MVKGFQRIQYGLMALLFTVATLATSIVFSSQASALSGAGTEADPWQIATCADLQDLNDSASYRDDYFVLTSDINCNGVDFTRIMFGNDLSFQGHFEGADHTIRNVTINNSVPHTNGLFGHLEEATVVNLTLENIIVSGEETVGTLAGRADLSSIENVNVTSGTVTGIGEMAHEFGGLFGYAYETQVFNVIVDVDVDASEARAVGGLVGSVSGGSEFGQIAALGDVEGFEEVGGLVGVVNSSLFDKAFATGNVIAHAGPGGGLVGIAYESEFIGTYARGNVTGSGYLGGHTGYLDYGSVIGWAYATGAVTPQGESIGGGLVGYRDEAAAVQDDSFWDVQTSGMETSAGVGEVGKTTAEMKDMETYIPFGWNFDDYWFQGDAVNDGYLCQIWYQVCYDAFMGGGSNGGGGSSNLPNNGDGNNDGILDEEQNNVTTILSPVSNKYVTVAVDESCGLSDVSIANNSTHAAQDSSMYSYQSGFVNFTASGCDENIANVKIYYHGVSPSGMIARKYNPNTNTYFTITSAAITTASSPLNGTLVSYTIADNSELDINPTNGIITDPVGLAAVTLPGAPNTGFASQKSTTILSVLALIPVLLTVAILGRKYLK